jgi:hypothetical protein
MIKKTMTAVIAAVFLNVSGAYAERMSVVGVPLFFSGDGGTGVNFFLPQVGYMSAEKDYVTKVRVIMGVLDYYEEFAGWKFNRFDYSVLFDLTLGIAPTDETELNASAGLTAEFYFLPAISQHSKIGVGVGGGWGYQMLLSEERKAGWPTPYGAPYARVTIPVLLGVFKTGVYFDYYFMDGPYTQFNIILALMMD